jgi:CRP/FNR family transcriptional regulator, cyclic AMP receptor protein
MAANNNKRRDFDPDKFLATIGEGRKILSFRKKQTIFAQGDPADAVFFIQQGKAKLSVVSKTGREATIGILSSGDFFGEGSFDCTSLSKGS